MASLAMIMLVVMLMQSHIEALSCSMHYIKNQKQIRGTRLFLGQSDLSQKDLREEADALLSRARQLREEIGVNNAKDDLDREMDRSKIRKALSPWSVKNEEKGDEYRLYIDIGREEGTWMDRRWGASGRRIPFTIDIKFLTIPASAGDVAKMVKDNYMGKSSQSYATATADAARLRGGFDKMKCSGGCYRIDSAKGKDTLRFYLDVDGTSQHQDYGDISVPGGCLYFSLPCFGGKTSQLSMKEGIVSVRQVGWNTGWRREESRIVGNFYAQPIESARQRDGF